MDIELAKCECCGLKEDCTQEYITEVKSKFVGKWLCGLCAEAVTDEVINRGSSSSSTKKLLFDDQVVDDDAVKAHMAICQKFKSNPAVRVADGMRQMLRRRSGNLSSSLLTSSSTSTTTSATTNSKKYMRSTTTISTQYLS